MGEWLATWLARCRLAAVNRRLVQTRAEHGLDVDGRPRNAADWLALNELTRSEASWADEPTAALPIAPLLTPGQQARARNRKALP